MTELRRSNRGHSPASGAISEGSTPQSWFAREPGLVSVSSRRVPLRPEIRFCTAADGSRLAVATYGAALGLDFIKNGNKVVKAFAETTMKQHKEHGQAFNAMAKELGGAQQTKTNPKYQKVVTDALPTLTDPAKVVDLATALETVATETYVNNISLLEDNDTKALMASVMGVESQHLATLRAVGALLGGGAAGAALIAIPTDVAKLPAAAGSVAFPQPFEGTEKASPPEEGAVK